MNVKEFVTRFPTGEKIGEGGDGHVYITLDGKYAVKHCTFQFPKEFYFNLTIPSHPNILKPIAWTLYKLAMPLGIDLITAIQQKLLTPKQIVMDLFSGFCHLKQLGILHGDFYSLNFIFQENRVKIIDFGSATYSSFFHEWFHQDIIDIYDVLCYHDEHGEKLTPMEKIQLFDHIKTRYNLISEQIDVVRQKQHYDSTLQILSMFIAGS